MAKDLLIPEAEVRKIVRLLGTVARSPGPLEPKRMALMSGLCKLIEADAWSWIVSRASEKDNNPAIGTFLHGGMTREQVGAFVRIMQDQQNTPVEYAALNSLRHKHDRFTRTWDQLVTRDQWYSPTNMAMVNAVGYEHILYSVKVLDEDGLFSGIALKRRPGRENFTPLQRRIAHVVITEVDWLHYEENIASVTKAVRPLPPRLRTVLTLLLEGFTVQEIATQLGRAYYTINDRMKEIHRHFGVKNRTQLLRRFVAGDGNDIG